MKIAVIAAQGRSGRACVAELLAGGHQVVAGVRGEPGMPDQPGLTFRQCDATKLQDVQALLDGCEAVVSMIGHVRGSQADVQTAATMNLVRAARHSGLKRVVSLTGTGVRFAGDHYGPVDRFMNLAVKLIDPARVQDGIDHADILKASGLDWTIIRVLKLTNARAGRFSLTPGGPGKPFVARAEVAQAVRSVLEGRSYIQQAPVISPATSS